MKDLLIVVPYRNREQHLESFLQKTPEYFDKENITYDILICELDQNGDWNAGLCCNSLIKFVNQKRDYKWLYIHHVDVSPIEGEWTFPNEREMFWNLGDYGSCLMSLSSFLEVGGYSNSFWGWGGEDNDLYQRFQQFGYSCINREHGPVKYDTTFQGHERKFNPRNYANGLNVLFVQPKSKHNTIANFDEHAIIRDLIEISPNIYKHIVVSQKISPDKHQSKNLLLTFTKNNSQFENVAAYIKSACIYSAYSFDFVVVVADEEPNDYFVNQIEAHGAKVYKTTVPVKKIFIDRFVAYKDFLQLNPQYEYVLHTDFTDVYFQNNPFEFLDKTRLTLTSEDIKIKDQSWNISMLQNLYGNEICQQIENNSVLCGGIIGAPRNLFIEFVDKIVEESKTITTNQTQGIDQPIINKIIYYNNVLKDQIDIKGVQDQLAINLHVFKYDSHLIDTKINIGPKTVSNPNNLRYAVVHQYDRFPDLYSNIHKHFNSYFMPV